MEKQIIEDITLLSKDVGDDELLATVDKDSHKLGEVTGENRI